MALCSCSLACSSPKLMNPSHGKKKIPDNSIFYQEQRLRTAGIQCCIPHPLITSSQLSSLGIEEATKLKESTLIHIKNNCRREEKMILQEGSWPGHRLMCSNPHPWDGNPWKRHLVLKLFPPAAPTPSPALLLPWELGKSFGINEGISGSSSLGSNCTEGLNPNSLIP